MNIDDPTITKIANLTTNGNVTTSGGNGTLGVDTTAYTPTTRTISTTAPLTGGGDLSANRTLAIPAATDAADGYLTSTDHATFAAKVGGSGTTGQIPKFTAAATIGDSIITESSGKIGVATTTPVTELALVTTGTTLPRGISCYQYNDGSQAGIFRGGKARGTPASPTKVLNGDGLFNIQGDGYADTKFITNVVQIQMVAEDTFTDSSSPSSIRFLTCATGSTTSVEKMRITPNGAIGIANGAPDTTAILDVVSTTRGFLPPRMTTTQRLAISTPAEGLAVYDLTLHALFVWNGSAWQAASGALSDYTQITKSADQDVTNNGTPQNDTELNFSVTANHRYHLVLYLILGNSDTAGGYVLQFGLAAGTMKGRASISGTTSTPAASAAQNTGTSSNLGQTSLSDVTEMSSFIVTFSFLPDSNTTLYFKFANSSAAAGRISRTCKNSTMFYKDIT